MYNGGRASSLLKVRCPTVTAPTPSITSMHRPTARRTYSQRGLWMWRVELSPRRGDAWIPSCSIIFVYHDRPSPRWGGSATGQPLLSVEWLSYAFFDYPDRVTVFVFSRVVMPDDLDSLRVVRSQSLPRPPSDGRRTVPLWVVTYQCSGRFRLINNII